MCHWPLECCTSVFSEITPFSGVSCVASACRPGFAGCRLISFLVGIWPPLPSCLGMFWGHNLQHSYVSSGHILDLTFTWSLCRWDTHSETLAGPGWFGFRCSLGASPELAWRVPATYQAWLVFCILSLQLNCLPVCLHFACLFHLRDYGPLVNFICCHARMHALTVPSCLLAFLHLHLVNCRLL